MRPETLVSACVYISYVIVGNRRLLDAITLYHCTSFVNLARAALCVREALQEMEMHKEARACIV